MPDTYTVEYIPASNTPPDETGKLTFADVALSDIQTVPAGDYRVRLITNYEAEVTVAALPGAPTGLTVTPGPGTNGLAWTAPASDGGNAITGYRIERKEGAGAYSDLVADTGTTAVAYDDDTALSGTAYTYRVSAINGVGTGTPSNEDSGTPTGPTYVQKFYDTNATWRGRIDPGGSTFNRMEFSLWTNLRLLDERLLRAGSGTFILVDATGRLSVTLWDTSPVEIFEGETAAGVIATGTLYHIYVSADLTGTPNVNVYVDGALVAFENVSTALTAGNGFIRSNLNTDLMGNGTDVSDGIFADPYLSYSASARLGVAAFYGGGTPPDLTGVGAPQLRLGGAQTAAQINAGENLGSGGTLLINSATLTDVV